MIDNPLEFLLPQRELEVSKFAWATVTSLAPLRVRLDTQTVDLDIAWKIYDPELGDRVRTHLDGKLLGIVGIAGGPIPPPPPPVPDILFKNLVMLGTQNIDTLLETNYYGQTTTANATKARNYPFTAHPQIFEVVTTPQATFQRAQIEQWGAQFTRAKWGTNAFTPWRVTGDKITVETVAQRNQIAFPYNGLEVFVNSTNDYYVWQGSWVNKLDDTGWISRTLRAGYTAADGFAISKKDGIVYMTGSVKRTAGNFPTNADNVIFSLPNNSWLPRGYNRIDLAGYGSGTSNTTFAIIRNDSLDVAIRGVGASLDVAWVGNIVYRTA